MPVNAELSGRETSFINGMSCERVLKQELYDIKRDYDYSLPDGMPLLGLLTINLVAARVPQAEKRRHHTCELASCLRFFI